MGLVCEKEQGSPAAIVREVSARGSAARQGTVRPGDLLLSIDGANISQVIHTTCVLLYANVHESVYVCVYQGVYV